LTPGRSRATLQGTLARLAPGFDIIRESQSFSDTEITAQLAPVDLRDVAIKEVLELAPSLRRLPRRFDRITAAIERGQLSTNVRLLADPRDQEVFSGYLHQALVCVLAATTGIMAVVLLASQGSAYLPRCAAVRGLRLQPPGDQCCHGDPGAVRPGALAARPERRLRMAAR